MSYIYYKKNIKMGDKIIVKHYFCDPENPFLRLISIKNLQKLRNSNH